MHHDSLCFKDAERDEGELAQRRQEELEGELVQRQEGELGQRQNCINCGKLNSPKKI